MRELRADRIDALVQEYQDKGGEIKDLAALVEVSPEYIWKLRKNKSPNVSAVILGRLALALGVATDYLLGADRNESGMPVVEGDLVHLVRDLNELDKPMRAKVVAVVRAALELVPERKTQTIIRPESFDQLLDTWSPSDLDRLQRAIRERLAAERGETAGQSSAESTIVLRGKAGRKARRGSGTVGD